MQDTTKLHNMTEDGPFTRAAQNADPKPTFLLLVFGIPLVAVAEIYYRLRYGVSLWGAVDEAMN